MSDTKNIPYILYWNTFDTMHGFLYLFCTNFHWLSRIFLNLESREIGLGKQILREEMQVFVYPEMPA